MELGGLDIVRELQKEDNDGIIRELQRRRRLLNFNFDELGVNLEIRNPRMGIIKIKKMMWIRRILSNPRIKRDPCSVLQVI